MKLLPNALFHCFLLYHQIFANILRTETYIKAYIQLRLKKHDLTYLTTEKVIRRELAKSSNLYATKWDMHKRTG